MIPVKNVYYMLMYAWQEVTDIQLSNLEIESFQNTADLLTELLLLSLKKLRTLGIDREYIPERRESTSPHGQIDFASTISSGNYWNRRVISSVTVLNENTYLNRILKTTLKLLINSECTDKHKESLRLVLRGFRNVKTVHPDSIDWNIKYNRLNNRYRYSISICYLILKGLLQKNENGERSVGAVMDDLQLERLYEKFLLGYFQKKYPELRPLSRQIAWGGNNSSIPYLPIMRTDVTLETENAILIIDAKYYQRILSGYFGSEKIPSANLYQIFTYVKNMAFGIPNKKVSGMLLYAATDEDPALDCQYTLCGSSILVKTLDLSRPFNLIENDLDTIAREMGRVHHKM